VLSKLIALGGSTEEESFEVQVKVRLADPAAVQQGLAQAAISVLRKRHYREHDVYFSFEDPTQGRLRYREDDFLDERGNVTNTRARLTLIGQKHEGRLPQDVMLSRSRYLAPATQSLRFYREYFKPQSEQVIEKERLRWLVTYDDREFFINLDRFSQPEIGNFLEIKSRTWSRRDAEQKAAVVVALLGLLGAAGEDIMSEDFVEML
jgi:5-methylthioadenosine/S-adenosylhomocysteine deaminase